LTGETFLSCVKKVIKNQSLRLLAAFLLRQFVEKGFGIVQESKLSPRFQALF